MSTAHSIQANYTAENIDSVRDHDNTIGVRVQCLYEIWPRDGC